MNYTAEQVEVLSERDWLTKDVRKALCELAALLREREAVVPVAWLANDGTGRVIDAKAKSAGSRAAATGSAIAVYSIPLCIAPAALESVAPMLSVQVPDVVTPVHAASGLNASERHAWALGWNDCRDAMLAAAPKRGEG